ncbi:MaoC/PaaZ C-terminal domain-containing protein [Hwanghaeella sp.]|uniref:MaoC/PaaZ C-terminal domain-containing protein n=1 Tax=Hwanghaeella sp. TaxID=2605943 RepID=UPI003CCB965C
MAIDPDYLLNIDLPEVRQTVGPRDYALYALSIGVGQDPLDERQLRYVGGFEEIEPFPAMPVVLGHPGFWLSDPKTGVDAVRLVHGEQGMTVHAPCPAEGVVVGKTRVTGLVDKGEGRGALLYWEKELRDADAGTLLATTRSTVFLRGDGGFGGPSGPVKQAHKMPETDPELSFESKVRPEQALLYRWQGDDNPLHRTPEVASKAGFDRPILHGLCTMGMACHGLLAVLCDYDASRFRGVDLRFTAVVFPGETLRTEIWRDGSFRTRVLERDKIVIDNGKFDYIR